MKTNVTLEQIAERLSEVFTDVNMSEDYEYNGKRFTAFCGWCGMMSPESRPAYVDTFGRATVEAAEELAYMIIDEQEAKRNSTKYHAHTIEANDMHGIPSEGGFFWSVNSGLKCDGGTGLYDELENITRYAREERIEEKQLVCASQLIEVSEDDFARPSLADELVLKYNLRGGSSSDDVEENEDWDDIIKDKEKMATFFTVGALVVSPSGRFFLIDSEGYNYARYIYLPINYKEMYEGEIKAIEHKEEERKANEQREREEEEQREYAEYLAKCEKWSRFMQRVDKLEEAGENERKITSVQKHNILAMCRTAFPGVKFSVRKNRGWGADWSLTWFDGPTLEELKGKTDLRLFRNRYDTFDGMTDCAGIEYEKHTEFSKMYMGSNGGNIETERTISNETRERLEKELIKILPEMTLERGEFSRKLTQDEVMKICTNFGVDYCDIIQNTGYIDNIIRRIFVQKSLFVEPEQAEETNNEEEDNKETTNTETDAKGVEGVEIVEIPGGVAVSGDTYKYKEQIKSTGAYWHRKNRRWQATSKETSERLKAWYYHA